jgi:hypothetical protein
MKSLSYRGYSNRHVLSLLADLPNDCWASDEDTEKLHPVRDLEDRRQRTTNLNHQAGLVVYQVLRSPRKGLSNSTPTVDEKEFAKLTKGNPQRSRRPRIFGMCSSAFTR